MSFVRFYKIWFLQAQLERQANEHVNGQNKVQAEMSALKKDHDVAKDKVARCVKFYLQYIAFEYHFTYHNCHKSIYIMNNVMTERLRVAYTVK